MIAKALAALSSSGIRWVEIKGFYIVPFGIVIKCSVLQPSLSHDWLFLWRLNWKQFQNNMKVNLLWWNIIFQCDLIFKAGTIESCRREFQSSSFDRTVYFAVYAFDDSLNSSPKSNVISLYVIGPTTTTKTTGILFQVLIWHQILSGILKESLIFVQKVKAPQCFKFVHCKVSVLSYNKFIVLFL